MPRTRPSAGRSSCCRSIPTASAQRIREQIRRLADVEVGVVIADSFGRPWRSGLTDVAIGVAGIRPLRDLRGQHDRTGYELRATVVAVADEIAAAADLARGKTEAIPVVIVRGLDVAGEGSAQELVLPHDRNLFP